MYIYIYVLYIYSKKIGTPLCERHTRHQRLGMGLGESQNCPSLDIVCDVLSVHDIIHGLGGQQFQIIEVNQSSMTGIQLWKNSGNIIKYEGYILCICKWDNGVSGVAMRVDQLRGMILYAKPLRIMPHKTGISSLPLSMMVLAIGAVPSLPSFSS